MITLKNLERISPYVWEIPKSYRADMRAVAWSTPARRCWKKR